MGLRLTKSPHLWQGALVCLMVAAGLAAAAPVLSDTQLAVGAPPAALLLGSWRRCPAYYQAGSLNPRPRA